MKTRWPLVRIEGIRKIHLHIDILLREIGSRVGRNQTNVMRLCGHWMKEGTTDRRGRSHPPQCTLSREDRQIVRSSKVSLNHCRGVWQR
ncbi:transposable element Tcb1 transposase [Trichonephila clavipes]|nr:transposable element Tcb1 transposase [Trichonephila clavipes]